MNGPKISIMSPFMTKEDRFVIVFFFVVAVYFVFCFSVLTLDVGKLGLCLSCLSPDGVPCGPLHVCVHARP